MFLVRTIVDSARSAWRLENARYEPVQPRHSWNASERVTNWYLFNLQQHSDLHYLASRPYYNLRQHPDAPQLPVAYGMMILLAAFPFMFRTHQE